MDLGSVALSRDSCLIALDTHPGAYKGGTLAKQNTLLSAGGGRDGLVAVLCRGCCDPTGPMVQSRAWGEVGVGNRLTPLHPHLLSDSASSNPKTVDGGHSSQEIKSETSSNPSSPEICPSKEK